MSKSTISPPPLFELFPDQESARAHLEERRWPEGARCPVCGLGERITARKNGYYRCNQCKEDFTIRTGTIFERSHVPLHKWIYAMYLLVMARKGISSLQLAKQIGVTQKTAWFVLRRLREACGGNCGPASFGKDFDAAVNQVLGYRPLALAAKARERKARKRASCVGSGKPANKKKGRKSDPS